MSFILGCNYWASNAGTEMWREFDLTAIKNDLSVLSENGIKYLRVFPLWRDFQPVTPLIGPQGRVSEYMQNGKAPQNKYFLDEDMLMHFAEFLDVCDSFKIKVIVGLITGWMSGALFIPTALYGKNIITDPMAQYFEQLFIKGFIERFKDREAVLAWDLGNECNGMSPIDTRFEAASWTAMVSNAIRSADNTRPIVSGMHGLDMTQKWTIRDQGEFTDLLTTHPYPFWCEHTRIDETLSFRTTLLPTAQGKYYSDIGKRPCLTEELGTMGPMICSDKLSADFLRVNLFSLWANGSEGVMWWCSSDQSTLNTFPYTHQMVERELGLLTVDGLPKPQLLEFKKFEEFLNNSKITLPSYESDAVCILSRDQRHWGIAYMTYLLARRAGLNISFSYIDDELPDSSLYLLPSVNYYTIMRKSSYDALKEKVKSGASLYISLGNAILSNFEDIAGLRVTDSFEYRKTLSVKLGEKNAEFFRERNVLLEPNGARVIAYDSENNPFISENVYGNGKVYFVNAPIEDNLIDSHGFDRLPISNLYKFIFADTVKALPIKISDSDLLTTLHKAQDCAYVTVINHFGKDKSFKLSLDGYELSETLYGKPSEVKAYDACVFKFTKK